MRTLAVATLCASAVLTGCVRTDPPFSPADSIKTMQLEQGFRLELVAAEPDIVSPVAMDIDENGRIFVVEMPGYPLDTRPTGRIKLLELGRDGRIVRSTVFADGLVLPTGVMRWKRGVLVTAAPDVLYLEDTDGDGKADRREVVLTGFAFSNPQHTVNTPIYGLDNWIYLAHEGPAEAIIFKETFGDRGSDIRFPGKPNAPTLRPARLGVRFQPDTLSLETLAGRSQFGHGFDAWGHYFTLDNSNHTRHEVIAARYLKRNPYMIVPSAMQNASDHGAAATVYPITRRPTFELLTEVGQFTSACSLTFYLGGAFPPGFERSSFVAEPVHNLVHRDVWSAAGSTFVASRAEAGREFLASSDSWFRPVNFYIGPDGALYLVDYYRKHIEHPEWTSSEHHHGSPDFYEGSNRGRIYRIVSNDAPLPPAPARIALGGASDDELVSALERPNVWWRRTAQRLLVDRQNAATTERLVRLVHESRSPLARLHALWTLDGLGRLEIGLIEQALGDPDAGVRENAIRLAEARLATLREPQGRPEQRRGTTVPALVDTLLRLEADADARVRFQLLCTLGSVDSPQAQRVRERLLLRDIEDEWMQTAALSSSSSGPSATSAEFDRAVAPASGLTGAETPGRAAFFRRLGSIIAARQDDREIVRTLDRVATPSVERGRRLEPDDSGDWWRTATLEGLARGARARAADPGVWRPSQPVLLRLFEESAPGVGRAALELLKVAGLPATARADETLARAAATATDRAADPVRRANAIDLLALRRDRLAAIAERLRSIVEPAEPDRVRAAAARALGQIGGDDVAAFLLSKWRTFTPEVRHAAADALLRESGPTRSLLSALKQGVVQPWTLDFGEKRRLLMHRDSAIRDEARAILEPKPGEREAVLTRFDRALDLSGDVARGEQAFKRVCEKCHRMNGAGADVGPDLGTVRNRPASLLLADILVPSRSIAAGYEAYVVERISGGVETGVLHSQSPDAIVLRREEGKETIVSRRDIKQMTLLTLSLMPPDLDAQLDPQQMADLIAFIRGGR
jgi:putative membrane-bound dehydrogenase-like protein